MRDGDNVNVDCCHVPSIASMQLHSSPLSRALSAAGDSRLLQSGSRAAQKVAPTGTVRHSAVSSESRWLSACTIHPKRFAAELTNKVPDPIHRRQQAGGQRPNKLLSKLRLVQLVRKVNGPNVEKRGHPRVCKQRGRERGSLEAHGTLPASTLSLVVRHHCWQQTQPTVARVASEHLHRDDPFVHRDAVCTPAPTNMYTYYVTMHQVYTQRNTQSQAIHIGWRRKVHIGSNMIRSPAFVKTSEPTTPFCSRSRVALPHSVSAVRRSAISARQCAP